VTRSLVVTVPDAYLYEDLHDHFENVTVYRWNLDGPAPVDVIDLCVAHYTAGLEQFDHLGTTTIRNLQWQSIGYDGLVEALPSGITIANAATVHETSTAELAVGLMIAAQRDFADHLHRADRHEWVQSFGSTLADRRVLLVGYGGIGKAIEERLRPFEVEITRVASKPRDSSYGPVHGVDALPTLLASCDILAVSLPLTDTTELLFGHEYLRLLPDGALVVNVGRGRVFDTDALVAHGERLRYALDVVDPEPLPSEHPLWSVPHLLLTPHVGGGAASMHPRMLRLVREQISRLRVGDGLAHVVHRG
jgi:phosphoglycerate dehydrogenase-like enzyme